MSLYIINYNRMKVLLSDNTYSYLFPGGKQVHAEKLYANLKKIDVEVHYENWFDPRLEGDTVHFFGFNDIEKIKALKLKGYKLVYTHILDGVTNLPKFKLKYHYLKNKIIKKLPSKFDPIFPWRALDLFDAIVYMHKNDRDTAVKIYGVNPNKTHIIPHAVDSLKVFESDVNEKKNKEKYLVSLGSIVPRKNVNFTAEICKNNNIPIKFIGHPFDKESTYYKEFVNIANTTKVEYLNYLDEEEKIKVLKGASGFVLLSFGESGCIAVYEAGATGLPLLLSDLPWAKGYDDPKSIEFCSPTNYKEAEKKLIEFYKSTEKQNNPTFKVRNWEDIAKMYRQVYKSIQ